MAAARKLKDGRQMKWFPWLAPTALRTGVLIVFQNQFQTQISSILLYICVHI